MNLKENDLLFWKYHNHQYCLRIEQNRNPEDPRGTSTYMYCRHPHATFPNAFGCSGQFFEAIITDGVPKDVLLERETNGFPPYCKDGCRTDYRAICDHMRKYMSLAQKKKFLSCLDYYEVLPIWSDGDYTTVSCDKNNLDHIYGFIGMTKTAAMKDFNATDANWREIAVAAMTNEVRLCNCVIQKEVYDWTLYEYDTTLNPIIYDGSKATDWTTVDMRCCYYGTDICGNGIANDVGHGIRNAIRANAARTGHVTTHTVSYETFDIGF